MSVGITDVAYRQSLPLGSATGSDEIAALAGTTVVKDIAQRWAELAVSKNTVRVFSEADLPAPSGGVILLDDNKHYIVSALISTSNTWRIPANGNVKISAGNFINAVTYTGTGTFIDGPLVNSVEINDISILGPGTASGVGIDIRSDTVLKSSRMTNVRIKDFNNGLFTKDMAIVMTNVDIRECLNNCIHEETFARHVNCVMLDSAPVVGGNTLTWKNTGTDLLGLLCSQSTYLSIAAAGKYTFNLSGVLASHQILGCVLQSQLFATTVFNPGTKSGSITSFADASPNTLCNAAGHTLVNGDVVNIRGDCSYIGAFIVSNVVASVSFEIAITFVDATANSVTFDDGSVLESDPALLSKDNTGLRASQTLSECSLSADSITTINTADVAEIINGTWDLGPSNELFRAEASGKLTYIGQVPVSKTVEVHLSLEKVGGGTNAIAATIFLGGSEDAFSRSPTTTNSNPSYVEAASQLVLNPGDTIEGGVVNEDGASNINVLKNSKMLIR